MADENKLFSWIYSKVVYSLSFLLIIFTLRDSILLLFPSGISFEFLWMEVSPDKFLNITILVLFLSVYFYGINYIIKDPLSKIKKYTNVLASILWAVSFLSPFYILIILFFHSLLIKGIALTIFSLLFVLLGIFVSIWSEKQERESDSMDLEQEIEKLKLEPEAKNSVAEFLRYYMILESLIKDAIVDKIKISIEEDESINLMEAADMLLDKGFIEHKTKEDIDKLEMLRNRIVHEEYKISEKEISQIKELVRNFDSNIKGYNRRPK
jgi:uncharacterized protein YutE (UPF0331/DUF86 family)